MAEIIQKDGTWAFDGETVRIVPGRDRGVSLLRRALGEVAVPLHALAGISFEPGKRSGRLRLRLRNGADPLLQITQGKLDDASDPYRLVVEGDRSGVAEYFVDEVRNALLLDQVDDGPTGRYLLPGPALPIAASAGDGTVAFDGDRIRLSWNWKTEESKSSGGERSLELADVEAVEWLPAAGLENGFLRFVSARSANRTPPKYDPHAIDLWGFRKDPLMALVAAAVAARLPHPYATAAPDAPPASASPLDAALPTAVAPPATGSEAAPQSSDDHDALLRRLRELGELHQAGILTDEEFSLAKKAVLRRM
ncbi:DUF4429 domain-containing protein [Streptomyces sp. HNM0663]|uniref:DUF4429 domain-containing protein n=1 Tax=Streptomyces chengmaiensis TaxID=3040919 RepID=A0ABT6HTM2_9ACTN|nr:DUF4429 domain-containing protein [Streptomyces chengmaiensis]MDH2391651.1 DUF4429 domain-containing protein [Streptomyces chengmaiensis]